MEVSEASSNGGTANSRAVILSYYYIIFYITIIIFYSYNITALALHRAAPLRDSVAEQRVLGRPLTERWWLVNILHLCMYTVCISSAVINIYIMTLFCKIK